MCKVLVRSRSRLLGFGALVALLAAWACRQEGGLGFTSDVSVHVTVFGDGDGSVTVSDAEPVPWYCTLSDGQTSSSLVGSSCLSEFGDAGLGGSVGFLATAAAGSVFGGWGSDCSGTQPTCDVDFGSGGASISVVATFLLVPEQLAITVDTPALEVSETAQATASATAPPGRSFNGLTYEWSSSPAGVVSISGTGATVAVTAVSAGTADLTATARDLTSNVVTLTVSPSTLPPGVMEGVLYDLDDVTPLDSIYLSMGPVAGSPGIRVGGRTGRQIPGDPVPVPAGGYRFTVDAGRYAIFSVGVLDNRWLSTPGDTADVVSADTTTLDLYVKRGYGLDMKQTDLGTITASAGASVDLVVDYQAWSRDLCPACTPSLAIGVDGTALTVYRFGTPGVYPGTAEQNVVIPVTIPSSGGTFYAMLVTVSTGADIQPGLDQYTDRWNAGLQASTLIPIGALVVN